MGKDTGTLTAQRKYGLYLTNTSYLGWYTSTTGGFVDPAGAPANTMLVTNAVWSHLARTYDGSLMTFFVNGLSSYNIAQSGTLLSQTTAANIGLFATGGLSPYDGSIYDLMVSAVARSANWLLLENNCSQANQAACWAVAGPQTNPTMPTVQ